MSVIIMMLQVYLQRMPELAGKTFGELICHLPQATAYGLVQSRSRRCLLNPPAETVIDRRDEIVVIRSTDLSKADIQPLAEPVHVDMGASPGCALLYMYCPCRPAVQYSCLAHRKAPDTQGRHTPPPLHAAAIPHRHVSATTPACPHRTPTCRDVHHYRGQV